MAPRTRAATSISGRFYRSDRMESLPGRRQQRETAAADNVEARAAVGRPSAVGPTVCDDELTPAGSEPKLGVVVTRNRARPPLPPGTVVQRPVDRGVETKKNACLRRARQVSISVRGQLDGHEVLLWIQIVFARLIHDTQLAVPLGVLIRNASVKLPQLQRGRVTRVLHTDDVLRFHAQSSYRLILISLRPTPIASYQCSSAVRSLPSERRTRAIPFRFRHLP